MIAATKLKSSYGFTLLEIVLALLIMSLIGLGAGLMIESAASSYLTVRENLEITQKAQIAQARMNRELMEITTIDTATSNEECIRYKIETKSGYFRTIGLNGSNLELKINSNNNCDCPSSTDSGIPLINRLENLVVSYDDGNNSALTTPPDLEKLVGIKVDFTVGRQDNIKGSNYRVMVNPRNNGRLNGPGLIL